MIDLSRATWRTSTYTSGNDCVEVAETSKVRAIRDSKDREGPALLFAPREFGALIARVKRGEHDL